jgi:NTE family protein
MLGAGLDVFRLRQYFDMAVRVRQLAVGVKEDVEFLDLARRALVSLPVDRPRAVTERRPFPAMARRRRQCLEDERVALVATGGSGALASVVGVARAMEESGVTPAVISVCSGSALFGFPLAAGLPADEVAEFTTGLRPADYVDVDWRSLATLVPRAGRGFAGLLRGDRLEETYRRLLGDMTLAEMPIPAYAPIWNIEENRTEYIGSATHPELSVARAVRMAVALPLFFSPVELDGGYWCDGGIVDIFPVHPVLDIEKACDLVLAVNGFYPPGFAGEDQTGWQRRPLSILDIAAQIRTAQQAQLARENMARLEEAGDVVLLEPVDYGVVAGLGFYRQFLDTTQWPSFMRAGRRSARRALRRAASGGRTDGAGGAGVSRSPHSARMG